MSYEKRVIYLFTVEGEEFAVTEWSDTTIEFEEARKNGQEVCHVYATARKEENGWFIEGRADPQMDINFYLGPNVTAAIETFLNNNGPPKP